MNNDTQALIKKAESVIAKLAEQGFQANVTVKIGDPDEGGVVAYFGQLIGPGPIMEADSMDKAKAAAGIKSLIPTWLAHPLDSSTMTPDTGTVARIIAPAKLHTILSTLWEQTKTHPDSVGQFMVRWGGLVKVKNGFMNDYPKPFTRVVSI